VRMVQAMAEDLDEAPLRERLPLATRDWLRTLPASTLHRLLGYDPVHPTHFRHGPDTPLPFDIVVVDEAYFPFSGRTLLPWREQHPNLAILRTVSKAGLAALRVGFLIARPELIRELDKIRLPYNVNTLSQQLALACLDAGEALDRHAREVVAGREFLAARLSALPGIRLVKSSANFLFFYCAFDANHICNYLLERGILIKGFPTLGSLRNCLRVTVGTAKENEEFLRVVQEFIAKQGV